MAIGTTWLLRNATTTNTVGHSYALDTTSTPDEEAFGDSRYFNSHDTTGWDGVTETNYQGTTADGTISRTDTIEAGGTYTSQS